MRGIARIRLPAGTRVAAPRSGLHLGADADARPVTLRLFRSTGTRVGAISTLVPVQLLALRAAGSGVLVRVITHRPGMWQPLLSHGADAGAIRPGAELPAPSGPSLIIDDRPANARRLADALPWRCRIEVRTPTTVADLRTTAQADMLLLGALMPELALAATATFGVSVAQISDVTSPASGSVTVLRRGGVDHVALDPSADETRLLQHCG